MTLAVRSLCNASRLRSAAPTWRCRAPRTARGLVERVLIRSRVDVKERLPRADFLSFLEVHRLDNSIDLGRDGDGLNRRHDPVGFDDVGDGRSTRGRRRRPSPRDVERVLAFWHRRKWPATTAQQQKPATVRDGRGVSNPIIEFTKIFEASTNVLRVSRSMCSEISGALDLDDGRQVDGRPLTGRQAGVPAIELSGCPAVERLIRPNGTPKARRDASRRR